MTKRIYITGVVWRIEQWIIRQQNVNCRCFSLRFTADNSFLKAFLKSWTVRHEDSIPACKIIWCVFTSFHLRLWIQSAWSKYQPVIIHATHDFGKMRETNQFHAASWLPNVGIHSWGIFLDGTLVWLRRVPNRCLQPHALPYFDLFSPRRMHANESSRFGNIGCVERRTFSRGGGKIDVLLVFQGCWQCHANFFFSFFTKGFLYRKKHLQQYPGMLR